jgi:SH3 domain-containing YSC84-like protein 1
MKQIALAAILVAALTPNARAQITSSEAARLDNAARVVRDINANIPRDYWNRAHCVVVIPELKKAALGFGGEYGKGAVSCRTGDGWTAPVFMQLIKGSWGFQAGVQQVDLVMLVMNESGVQKLLKNKVTLGADASVAAGPIGRQGQLGTDATLSAEIISYSRAAGLFAGIDLSGGVLRPDEDANRDAYGPNASPQTILASRAISAPPEAEPFLAALKMGPVPETPAATRAAEPLRREPRPTAEQQNGTATTASRTADADLRQRLVDMQQMLDRMMADANRPVATSGRDEDRTMVVDRVMFDRLRRELEAAIAALDRR